MRKLLLLAAVLSAALAIGIAPAGAITDGQPDGNGHPYVGLMVAHDSAGVPLWRCSGTMLSSTLFLTAGHCTEAPAAHVEIFFDSGDPTPIPLGNWGGPGTSCAGKTGYPCDGDAGGTPQTHPSYDPNAFFLFDAGVVHVSPAFARPSYGVLPQLNQLDALKNQRGQQDVTFTAVGYGLQLSSPVASHNLALRTRMVSHPKLNQINGGIVGDFAMLLSNNSNTGGTCFGDSGGPNFVGDSNVVAGVTSFGLNGNCAGTGGVYRIDRADDLSFIGSFLP